MKRKASRGGEKKKAERTKGGYMKELRDEQSRKHRVTPLNGHFKNLPTHFISLYLTKTCKNNNL